MLYSDKDADTESLKVHESVVPGARKTNIDTLEQDGEEAGLSAFEEEVVEGELEQKRLVEEYKESHCHMTHAKKEQTLADLQKKYSKCAFVHHDFNLST